MPPVVDLPPRPFGTRWEAKPPLRDVDMTPDQFELLFAEIVGADPGYDKGQVYVAPVFLRELLEITQRQEHEVVVIEVDFPYEAEIVFHPPELRNDVVRALES